MISHATGTPRVSQTRIGGCRFNTPYISPSLTLATAACWPGTNGASAGAASEYKAEGPEQNLFPWGTLPGCFYQGVFDVLPAPWPAKASDPCGKQQRVPYSDEGVPPSYLHAYWDRLQSDRGHAGLGGLQYATGEASARVEELLRARVLALRWLEEHMLAALGRRVPHPEKLQQRLVHAVAYPQKKNAFTEAAAGGFLAGCLEVSLLDAAWDALMLNRCNTVKETIKTITGRYSAKHIRTSHAGW